MNHYIGYGVNTYGNVSGETAMMKEIYSRGPIACSFATDDRFSGARVTGGPASGV